MNVTFDLNFHPRIQTHGDSLPISGTPRPLMKPQYGVKGHPKGQFVVLEVNCLDNTMFWGLVIFSVRAKC